MLKRIRGALGVASLLTVALILAYAAVDFVLPPNPMNWAIADARATECSTLLGTENADNATFYAGLSNSCGGMTYHPMGVIATVQGPLPTASGTSLQTLSTITLPANTLDVVGRRVYCRAHYHFATNADSKQITLQFGSGSSTLSSVAAASSNVNGFLEMWIQKSGSSTQIVTGDGEQSTTVIAPLFVSDTQTDTSALNISAQATDSTSSAGDVVLEDFFCEYAE